MIQMLVCLLIFTSTHSFMTILPFLTKSHVYECADESLTGWSKCQKKQICGDHTLKYGTDFRIMQESKIPSDTYFKTENWITDFNLFCTESYVIGSFGTCIFIGMIFGFVVFLPLSDKYGKLKFIIGGVIVS